MKCISLNHDELMINRVFLGRKQRGNLPAVRST